MLGCNVDSLDLIFNAFSPLMSFSFMFNWTMFLLGFSHYRGANFVHWHWDLGSV